jgi:hypothetical protein
MVDTDSCEAMVDGHKQVSSVTIKVAQVRRDEIEPSAVEFMESVVRSRSDG